MYVCDAWLSVHHLSRCVYVQYVYVHTCIHYHAHGFIQACAYSTNGVLVRILNISTREYLSAKSWAKTTMQLDRVVLLLVIG